MEKYMSKTILMLRNDSLKEVLQMVKEDKFPDILNTIKMLIHEAERVTEGVDEYLKGVEDETRESN